MNWSIWNLHMICFDVIWCDMISIDMTWIPHCFNHNFSSALFHLPWSCLPPLFHLPGPCLGWQKSEDFQWCFPRHVSAIFFGDPAGDKSRMARSFLALKRKRSKQFKKPLCSNMTYPPRTPDRPWLAKSIQLTLEVMVALGFHHSTKYCTFFRDMTFHKVSINGDPH